MPILWPIISTSHPFKLFRPLFKIFVFSPGNVEAACGIGGCVAREVAPPSAMNMTSEAGQNSGTSSGNGTGNTGSLGLSNVGELAGGSSGLF